MLWLNYRNLLIGIRTNASTSVRHRLRKFQVRISVRGRYLLSEGPGLIEDRLQTFIIEWGFGSP